VEAWQHITAHRYPQALLEPVCSSVLVDIVDQELKDSILLILALTCSSSKELRIGPVFEFNFTSSDKRVAVCDDILDKFCL
jgi:hypothetical protein